MTSQPLNRSCSSILRVAVLWISTRFRLTELFILILAAIVLSGLWLDRMTEASTTSANPSLAANGTRQFSPPADASGHNRRMPFRGLLESPFLNELNLNAPPPLAPLDPSGDPDTTFSGDGKVITNFAEVSQFAEARGVGIQSNGKIIIGGFSYEGGVNRYFAVLRLNTDGTQDFSFGNQNAGAEIGVAKLSIGTATSNINALAVYPVTGGVNDDKIVGAGFSQSGSDQFAIARFTKDGALDTTFGPDLHAPAGPDGYIEVDFAALQDRAAAVAIQDDGKIVVAGFAQDAAGQRQVAVVRLTTAGVLDNTFSGDGKATVDYTDLSATADDRGTAVAISGTGASRKIIVGGWTKVAGVSRFHLMQFTDNGNLDPAFGDSGKRVFPVINGASGGDEIRGLTLDSSNRIVASGYHIPGNLNALTLRFTTSGANYPVLDTTFNGTGYQITALSSVDTADQVRIQTDGKIVTFGYTTVASGADLLFIRLNSNGTHDNTYGPGSGALTGVVTVNISDSDNGFALALDSSNRAVGVGRRIDAQSNGYILAARVTTGGVSDHTFGPDKNPVDGIPDGFFITQLIGGSADATNAVAQFGGKTVLAGYTWGGTSYDMAVIRYNSDGTLDNSFSGDGKATTGSNNFQEIANGVAIQPSDQKVVAVGDTGGNPEQFTVWRFNNDGTLDNNGFGSGGVAKTSIGSNGNNLFAVALDPSGKIVAGGTTSSSASSSDFALLRFNTNGSLDTSFDTDGKVTLNIGTFDQIKAIALQPDGKIVVGGSSTFGSDSRFSIARFNANGSLDTSFASPNGYLSVRMSDAAAAVAGDEIRGIAVMSDGKIVAGGKALNFVAAAPPIPATSTNMFALLRVTSAGLLDNSFGSGGKVTLNLTSRGMDELNGIALQFDDKIMAFGSSMVIVPNLNPPAYNPGDLAVLRFNWDDGSLDTTYAANNGYVVTDLNGHDRGAGGVVYPDGKTLGAVTCGGEDFAAAKFLGDPPPTAPLVAPDLASTSDSGRFNNDNNTNDNTPTFIGSCVNGETMVLKINGADTSPRSRAICRNSVYSITAATPIPDGTYSFSVVSTNSFGASAASPGLGSVVIDTIALPPTITLPTAGSTVGVPSQTISGGGAETVAAVVVKENGNVVGSDPDFADVAGGAWSAPTMLGVCSHTITATQTDLAGNVSAPSASRQFYVKAPSTTALTQSAATTRFGEQATFTATVTSQFGVVNVGNAKFTVDAEAPVNVAVTNGQATLNRSNLSVGNHNIIVEYLISDCFEGSQGTPNPLSHTVIKADTTTATTSSVNPSVFGQSVVFTATIAVTAPGAGTTSGTVQFLDGANPIGGCASVSVNNSQATCNVSTLAVGSHTISAQYSGDGNFNPSSGAMATNPQVVNKANANIGITGAPNPSGYGQSVTFTATVGAAAPGAGTPTGTLQFLDGANPITGCDSVTISAGQAVCTTTTLTGGSHTISAQYSGDSNFNSGTFNMTNNPQVVNKANTTVGLTSSPNPSKFGQSVTFTATVAPVAPATTTPTGTVTFRDGGNPIVCDDPATQTLVNGVATCTTSTLSATTNPPPPHAMTALYNGDGNYNTSTSNTVSQTVIPCSNNPIVTSIADSGANTLRNAIANICSSPNNNITFNLGAGAHTITLSTGELAIAQDLTITNIVSGTNGPVTISGNNASRIFNINSGITATISNLNITGGNAASSGAIQNSGTLTLRGMAIYDNVSTGNGGAMRNDGTLTIYNSTLSGNKAAADGGGILCPIGSTTTMLNVTISNNQADSDINASGAGGGINSGGTVDLKNSIVAGNTAGNTPDNTSGTINDQGNNLLSGDPKVGALAFNGGPTKTHALLPDSPAVEAGDNTAATNAGLTTDQRGPGFPRIADSADADTTATVDIGAFELHPTIEDITDRITTEDTPLSFAFNIGDGTGALITSVTATSSNQTLVPNANLGITGSGSSRTLNITPAANSNSPSDGSATITVTVTATNGQTAQDTFVFTVTEVNDAPDAINDTLTTVNEDSGQRAIQFATLLGNDTKGPANESGQTLTVTAVSNFTNGTGILDTPNSQVLFTPTADFNGTASFDYTITDNGTTNGAADPKSDTATASFTVNAVNDAPSFTRGPDQNVAINSGAQTVNNWATNISAGPADESGQVLNFIVTNNNNALFSIQPAVSPTGTLTFTPAANQSGSATVSVTLHDNGGTANGGVDTSATQTFVITVAALNPLSVNGTGADDTLIINATDQNSGSYSLNGGPAVPFSGVSSFTFNGMDGNDLLQINNPAGGLFAPAGGIFFNGGGQSNDRLEDLGGSATSGAYTVGPTNDAGTITHNGPSTQTITFTGLAPITDTVAEATHTINATDAANVITLDNGTANGDGLLRVSIDAFEPEQFANKTNVVVNAGLSGADLADTINLNYTETSTGLAAVTFNGGEGDDTINVQATAGGVPASINGNNGNDTIVFSDGATLNGGTIDGGAGTANTLDYSAYTSPVAANLGTNAPSYVATMEAAQEVPPTTSTATGTATLTFNTATKLFDITVTVNGILPGDVTGFHIHRAPVGINGPIIVDLFPLGPLVPAGSGFTFTATNVALPLTQEAALLGGVTYINVHTAVFPAGAIRGQLFPSAAFAGSAATATGTAGIANIQNINGGSAGDSLVGSNVANVIQGNAGDDTIVGSVGNDTLIGGANNDTLVWSNGDNNDVIDGGADTDIVQINGSVAAGDQFTIAPGAGGRVAFARTNLVPFTLDIGTSETMIVNGIAGDDTFGVTSLAGVAGLLTLNLNGFDGNDIFNVAPSPTGGVIVRANGFAPVVLPGDTLNVDTSGGVAGTVLSRTNPGGQTHDGNYTFTNRQSIFFTNIETLNPSTVPTATNGTVGGRILDQDGNPVAGTAIRLTGTQNRLTITDASGNYRFDNVETAGFYTVTPARANYTFSPTQRSFSQLGQHTDAAFTGSLNSGGSLVNPLDTTEFFVRQQYLDILGREPDEFGFTSWVNEITNCAAGDPSCDRVHVSEMFFRSSEFQDRGYYLYRFYSTAFGRKPDYAEFTPDMARVSGFLTTDQLEAAKMQFAVDFTKRPAFVSAYGSLSNAAYVDALINAAQVSLANRQTVIDALNNGAIDRAQALRIIVESGEVYQKYYNQAFVVMEYFGYLHRDPDALYLDWIEVLNQTGDPRHMIEGFVNSSEYRNRFLK